MITGVPGVGKTTISSILKRKLDAIHINISKIVKERKLYDSIDRKRESLIINEHKLRSHILEIKNKTTKDIILDGYSNFNAIEPDKITIIFILRRAPWELEKVLTERGWPRSKVRENVEAEMVDVSLAEILENYEFAKICEMNTTGKSVECIVHRMLDIIISGKKCSFGNIDWLGFDETLKLMEEWNVRSY